MATVAADVAPAPERVARGWVQNLKVCIPLWVRRMRRCYRTFAVADRTGWPFLKTTLARAVLVAFVGFMADSAPCTAGGDAVGTVVVDFGVGRMAEFAEVCRLAVEGERSELVVVREEDVENEWLGDGEWEVGEEIQEEMRGGLRVGKSGGVVIDQGR